MKIILKPLGVLSVAAVVVSLSVLALRQNKSAAEPSVPAPSRATAANPWTANVPTNTDTSVAVSPGAIYDDALQNGWENYTWAKKNNFAYTDPSQKGNCIQVTPGAFEALYFHHAPMRVAEYDRITFRIRGDKAVAEQLKVIAQLDGAADTKIAPAPVKIAASPLLTNKPVVDALVMLTPTPNKWKTVVVPLKELAVEGKTNLIGFWLQETAGNKTAPTFYVDDVRLLRPTDLAPVD